jgi:3-hydroxybutyryl-CoA dehydrogenase
MHESDLVGIAGLGFLGRGIAACLVAHGFKIVAYTVGADTHERAAGYIDAALEEMAAHGIVSHAVVKEWPGLYTAAQSLADLAPCTFVIESVLEDFAIKQQVYEEIEAAVGADIPIASNTSALPITLLQQNRKVPQRFLGMHWSEPAYATRFLELIRGAHTGATAFEQAAALARRLDKEPSFVQRDVPGFIVNRLAYAMYREAVHLVETGVADVETIDRAFQNCFGLWAPICGPFRWIDITGGAALYATAMQGVLPDLRNSGELPPLLNEMKDKGYQGIKDGRGFYEYRPEDAEYWECLRHEQAWALFTNQEKSRS